MPQYRIQDSETGRTLLVEGDSPPSESEMAELFSQAAPAAPQQPQDASQDMLLTDEGPKGGMPQEASQDNGRGRIRSAAAEVGRSAVEGFGLGFKGLGVANTRIGPSPYASLAEQFNLAKTGLANPPADMTPGYRTGQAITEAGNRTFQPNPKYQNEWWASKIPQGVASSLSFIPAAIAGPVGISVAGAMVNGAAAYDEAKQNGADDDQATRTFWWNALGGTSEAFPLSRIIDRINKASKGAVGKWVKDVIASGFEEGVQEGAQQALQNIIAKHIYEPERKALEGVAEGAGVGAAVGLLLPGVGGGVKIAGQKAGEAVRQKYLRESTGLVPGGGTGGMIPVEPETPPTGGPGGTVVNFKTSDGSEGTLKLAPGTDPKVGVKAVKTQHKGATITGFEALPGPAAGITREQAESGASQGVAPSRFSSPVDAAIMASAPTEARVTPATAPEENLPPPGPPTSPVAVSAAEPESQAVTPTPPAPPVDSGVSTTEEESQAEKGPSDATGVRTEARLVPAQGVPVEGSQAQGGNQLEPGAPQQPQPVVAGEEAVAAKQPSQESAQDGRFKDALKRTITFNDPVTGKQLKGSVREAVDRAIEAGWTGVLTSEGPAIVGPNMIGWGKHQIGEYGLQYAMEQSTRKEQAPTRTPSEEPVPAPDQPATIEDKLRALKTNTRGMVMDVWAATYYSLKNAILDVAIGFIKVGKALDAAVRDAIAWGRVNFPNVKFDAAQMERDIYDGLSKVHGFSTGGLRGVQRVVRALDKDPVTAEKVSAQPFDPENIPTLMGKLSRPSAVTENFDRQLQTAKEAANTEDAYTKAAVLTMQAQLLRNMEESFYGKDPKLIPWWVKMFIPRQRLNEAHRAATHVAASLNVTQSDMLHGYTFEPFEMRAGPIPASIIERAGLQPGDTWQSQNWRGQKELLTIGPKVELEDGRTIYQLLRPMSVQTQKEVWQWFQQTYPEFEWLIDMWVNPALKGARETVNGVEVPIFNRWALMDRYGESDPKFAPREAYTPDVLVPSLLSGATAKWLKERKWTFREGVRSPGRKYETGAARESGAVLDLISGWSVRAAQVLREESRKRWLNHVIAAAVDVPNGNPAAIPKGWVKLENAIDDVWTAVQSMREWHGKGFPQVTATFADRNSPEFKAYFGELQKLHYKNRPKMLPKHVAESLIRDWEQQDNLGMMARTAKAIHQFITKDPELSEEWARKMRRGMEGWAMNYKAFLLLMPRTYLVNRTDNYLRFAYASWQRMIYAAMRGGDREAFGEARHLLWASMANLMPGVRQAFHLGENKLFNEAVTRSLVPQLFEQQTNLADLQVFGASVRDQVRSLYDQGLKRQAAALMAKNAGVLSLEATGYGNLDITAKQQMAFNLLLADAKQQANRLGLKGAARKEAIAAFVLHPPSEKLAAAIKYTNRALLNYSDTPQWINWAARHPAVSTVFAFPIFRYHWISRELDRATRGFKLEWDRLMKHKKISKEERANAWADFISWATMPAMGWGASHIAYALADSLLGLSAGADDEDDDPRKLVGSSTTIELDDEGNPYRKSMARDLVTSNRINMNRVARMFGMDTAGDEDWWLYIKGLPIIQSASLFHLAQSDARRFGFATGMKTALVGMRDLLSDMTGVGQAPKLAFKIAAELGNETDKPAYSWIDPYATSVPLSTYTTLLALQLIPGQRQADELLKWMDPTPRRITASKSLDYDPGVIEAIKQGGWTGIAHRIQRKISAGTFESDLPAKGHINRRLGEVDKPVTYGLAARIASLAGFNVKPVNRQEYEEQLDE